MEVIKIVEKMYLRKKRGEKIKGKRCRKKEKKLQKETNRRKNVNGKIF